MLLDCIKYAGVTRRVFLMRHLYLNGGWCLDVDLRTDTCRRDWITCSEFVSHSRLNSQHNIGGGGGLYDYLIAQESSLQ